MVDVLMEKPFAGRQDDCADERRHGHSGEFAGEQPADDPDRCNSHEQIGNGRDGVAAVLVFGFSGIQENEHVAGRIRQCSEREADEQRMQQTDVECPCQDDEQDDGDHGKLDGKCDEVLHDIPPNEKEFVLGMFTLFLANLCNENWGIRKRRVV